MVSFPFENAWLDTDYIVTQAAVKSTVQSHLWTLLRISCIPRRLERPKKRANSKCSSIAASEVEWTSYVVIHLAFFTPHSSLQIKAILLGASSVLLGRPYIYGLALGGQAGVEEVIRNLLAEVDLSLGLMGYKSLDEIRGLGIESLKNEGNKDGRGRILVRRDGKL